MKTIPLFKGNDIVCRVPESGYLYPLVGSEGVIVAGKVLYSGGWQADVEWAERYLAENRERAFNEMRRLYSC